MPTHAYCKHWSKAAWLALAFALGGCGTNPASQSAARPQVASKSSHIPVLPAAGSGKGAYYMDDGPGDQIPDGLLATPDAEPRIEPYSKRANRPYVVFGKRYTPVVDERPYKQRGYGSWYGKKFHGQRTSSGELYDMYKMTAAHPTLPIPSYVRVTNLENGKQVIVRVNDRGPFHAGRIIDLSYVAALKLGYLVQGRGWLEVERLLPEEIERLVSVRGETGSGAGIYSSAAGSGADAEALSDVEVRPVAAGTPVEQTQLAPLLTEPALGAAAARPAETGPSETALADFYIQFGAYSSAANAEAARKQMSANSAVVPGLEIVEQGRYFRLYGGPFATREDAVAAASQVPHLTGQPLVVQR